MNNKEQLFYQELNRHPIFSIVKLHKDTIVVGAGSTIKSIHLMHLIAFVEEYWGLSDRSIDLVDEIGNINGDLVLKDIIDIAARV